MASRTDPEKIFAIEEKIGEGSYGSVLKARHRDTNRAVAIKLVPVESDLKELMEEIEILKSCKCDNIVRYFGSYCKDNDLWIVMEYCGAGSMSDLMMKGRFSLKEEEIRLVISQVLLGVAYLHEHKKIHRDIKAGNILLTESGYAKLADFGVSAQLDSTISKRKTVIGTPFWMAPEVIKEEEYNCIADIWSLGITAIELAEGVPPYSNIHPMRAIFMIPNRPAPRLQNEGRWSKEFIDFVSKCLVKDPARRSSAHNLLSHPFVKDTIAQLNNKNAPLSIMVDMIARLRDMKAKVKKTKSKEASGNRLPPNSPPSKAVPQRAEKRNLSQSETTSDGISPSGTMVIKTEAKAVSSPKHVPIDDREHKPHNEASVTQSTYLPKSGSSDAPIKPLSQSYVVPRSIPVTSNMPQNIPRRPPPMNNTHLSSSQVSVPSKPQTGVSLSPNVKPPVPLLRPTQGISVTPASSRTPTVLDYCASSLIPELPTKKPSGTNLAEWMKIQKRGVQATEQFKEDLRILAAAYKTEMDKIINSMNALLYSSLL